MDGFEGILGTGNRAASPVILLPTCNGGLMAFGEWNFGRESHFADGLTGI